MVSDDIRFLILLLYKRGMAWFRGLKLLKGDCRGDGYGEAPCLSALAIRKYPSAPATPLGASVAQALTITHVE